MIRHHLRAPDPRGRPQAQGHENRWDKPLLNAEFRLVIQGRVRAGAAPELMEGVVMAQAAAEWVGVEGGVSTGRCEPARAGRSRQKEAAARVRYTCGEAQGDLGCHPR